MGAIMYRLEGDIKKESLFSPDIDFGLTLVYY